MPAPDVELAATYVVLIAIANMSKKNNEITAEKLVQQSKHVNKAFANRLTRLTAAYNNAFEHLTQRYDCVKKRLPRRLHSGKSNLRVHVCAATHRIGIYQKHWKKKTLSKPGKARRKIVWTALTDKGTAKAWCLFSNVAHHCHNRTFGALCDVTATASVAFQKQSIVALKSQLVHLETVKLIV